MFGASYVHLHWVHSADVTVYDGGHVALTEIAGLDCWVICLVFVAEASVQGCFCCYEWLD